MKTEKNIFVAFILNLAFSVFEFFGGIFTGSVAIVSDAVHDLGDAVSIGIAWLLEKKSKQPPNHRYTYGYLRYSVLGSLITTVILLLGSVGVIYNAVVRIISPREVDCNGMILLAVVGVCVNLGATFFTRNGSSLNQRAVNLHMLEDVLGWLVVLAGAVVMHLTDFTLIDPILSIGVAVFILLHALKNSKQILELFLEKTPGSIDISEIMEHILELEGILDVHHVHIWSLDGQNHYATMHIVSNADHHKVKNQVRQTLQKHGIGHVTLELERSTDHCDHKICQPDFCPTPPHHHH